MDQQKKLEDFYLRFVVTSRTASIILPQQPNASFAVKKYVNEMEYSTPSHLVGTYRLDLNLYVVTPHYKYPSEQTLREGER